MCLSLIIGSVLVVPEMTHVGLGISIASDLSKALLLGGIVTAILTVEAEAREARMRERQ